MRLHTIAFWACFSFALVCLVLISGCSRGEALKVGDKVADVAIVPDCSRDTRLLRAKLVNDDIQATDNTRYPQQTAAVQRSFDLMALTHEQGAQMDAAGTAFFADVMVLVGYLVAEHGINGAGMVSAGNYVGLIRAARQMLGKRMMQILRISAKVTAECQVQSQFDNAVETLEIEDRAEAFEMPGRIGG